LTITFGGHLCDCRVLCGKSATVLPASSWDAENADDDIGDAAKVAVVSAKRHD